MSKKKKIIVMAVMTTYCYLEVEAKDEDQAYDIAIDTDGGCFSADDSWGSGDWYIPSEDIVEIEKESQ